MAVLNVAQSAVYNHKHKESVKLCLIVHRSARKSALSGDSAAPPPSTSGPPMLKGTRKVSHTVSESWCHSFYAPQKKKALWQKSHTLTGQRLIGSLFAHLLERFSCPSAVSGPPCVVADWCKAPPSAEVAVEWNPPWATSVRVLFLHIPPAADWLAVGDLGGGTGCALPGQVALAPSWLILRFRFCLLRQTRSGM